VSGADRGRRSLFERLRSWTDRPPAGPRPPNVLLVLSDEHNAGVAGFAGNRVARTPNLDELAARGVAFDAAYCNSPLCGPSRMSLTAVRHPSRVGAWGNASWLPSDDVPSIARAMNAAGYESLLCGKQHYDATRRYGFRELGSWRTNQYRKTGLVRRRDPDDWVLPDKLSKRFSNFRPGDDSPVMRHDRAVTDTAASFLRRRSRRDAPFFLLVGYLAPHFPLIVPNEYWNRYRGRVPLPEIPPGHLESQPRNYRHLRLGFAMHDVPEETVRKGRELYYGLSEWMDGQVGRLLGALQRSRVADDTVVIYSSDHGETLGEHGLWWKNCAYEGATRVPLVVSWPERWRGGQRRGGACSLVDLMQTIAELGGAEPDDAWDGDSLSRWLDAPESPWKDRALSEYYGHNVASAFTMLRSGSWKYVYHTPPDPRHPAERELYDLAADPGEFDNRADDPEQAQRVETLHRELVREVGEDPDDVDTRCRAEVATGYQRSDEPS
jgi:choline-sulfatase